MKITYFNKLKWYLLNAWNSIIHKRFFIFLFFSLTLVCLNGAIAQNAFVRDYHTEIITDGKKISERVHLVLQVNNLAGVDEGYFSIYQSKHKKLKGLSGKITDTKGNLIRNQSKKEIKDISAYLRGTFYHDVFKKEFSLVHHVFPYLVEIEYYYEYTSFLNLTSWDPIWDINLPTQKSSLSFTYPVAYPFKYKEYHINPAVKTSTPKTETMFWEFEGFDISKNIYMPHYAGFIPRVSIVPLQFQYDKKGSFESWKEYGEWHILVGQTLDKLPVSEQQIIDRLTYGVSDSIEIIRILFRYMQENCRYVNVSVNFGGLIPYPASYVCTNKYGDCKALTNYMLAMLKYKGIRSHPVLIWSGNPERKVDPEFPMQVFNHVILCVPFANDSVWLECTAKSIPAGYVPVSVQNRLGLLVQQGNSRLVRIPENNPDNAFVTYSYLFNAEKEDVADVSCSFRLIGEAYESMRGILTYASKKDREEYMENFVACHNMRDVKWLPANNHRDSIFCDQSLVFTMPSPVSKIGNMVKITHPKLPLPAFEKPLKRMHPVYLYEKIAYRDTLQYSFAADGIPNVAPNVWESETDFGWGRVSRSVQRDTIIVIRSIFLNQQYIEYEDYDRFHQFYTELVNQSSSTVIKP